MIAPDLESTLDAYVTYRCNRRCTHCFMGEFLESATDLPLGSLTRYVDFHASRTGLSQIKFLGGEPLLYPYLDEALSYCHARGILCKIVTNSHPRLKRVIRDHPYVHLALSLESSDPVINDQIRGKGSFRQTAIAMGQAAEADVPFSVIISVSRTNLDTALDTIRYAGAMGANSVNVHYVTGRGFAEPGLQVPAHAWQQFRETLGSSPVGVAVRIEPTFLPGDQASRCLLGDERNSILLPDGRIFTCTMILERPDSHSFFWDGEEQRVNLRFRPPRSRDPLGCPASDWVDRTLMDAAASVGGHVACLFQKEHLEVSNLRNEEYAL